MGVALAVSKGTAASGRPSQNIFSQGHSKGPELGHSLFVGGVPHQEEAEPEKLGWPYVPVHQHSSVGEHLKVFGKQECGT